MGFGYTEEPHANAMETLVLSADGLTLDGHAVEWVQQPTPDSVRIRLTTIGDDDGRTALIAKTWSAGPHVCTLQKEVRYVAAPGEAEGTFFIRHTYRFRR